MQQVWLRADAQPMRLLSGCVSQQGVNTCLGDLHILIRFVDWQLALI